MARYIKDHDAIYELKRAFPADDFGKIIRCISRTPTADVPEKNVGKWTEMTVIHKDEAKDIIEEWQSCRCSICGHYDTRPYMYYFSEPKFCSWCSAEMRKEADNE